MSAPNEPELLKANIKRNEQLIHDEIKKKKADRDMFMVSVWRLEIDSMRKYLK